MYELYFDHPLTIKDSFYVCLRPAYGWEVSPNVSRPYIGCDISYNHMFQLKESIPYGAGIVGYNGSTGDWQYAPSPYSGTLYPILVPPDTDDVPQCMAPANFRKSGQRMEYPILAWDTTEGGQREYEIQYAPYNSDRWITFEPTENPATVFPASNPDIYYKARIRARCYHGCVVHSTWSWSPWSDPILFYTGPTEPDTTTAITPVEADATDFFTLSPNPATGKVTVTVGHTPQSGTHSSALAGTSPNLGEEFSLTLRDAAGHEVLRKSLPAGTDSVDLDLSHLPAGAYFVTLSTPAASATQRLVVK